jgi:ABC-2 type transport system ATP-binding protein
MSEPRRDGKVPSLRLRKLEKRFGERHALRGIDLEIAGPQIVGIVGPDGAGKTTLLRALAGLLEIQAEEATVLGYDLRGDVTPLKAHLGYVPQVFSLYRDLTVMENLRVTGLLNGLAGKQLEERARPLLERTGLAPFPDRQAGALSGGMKQKLAIVAALLAEPKLIILDEPTAGVDILARDEIWELLADRKREVLILMSTSYLDEAAACDRLVYLDEGRVVASGTPSALRESVPLELYRAWGEDPRAIASAARSLDYVVSARAVGRFARIEVHRDRGPGTGDVLRDLVSLGGGVAFAEETPVDMEATLLALARDHDRPVEPS